MTTKQDLDKLVNREIVEHEKFFNYECERLRILKVKLQESLEESDLTLAEVQLLNRIKAAIKNILKEADVNQPQTTSAQLRECCMTTNRLCSDLLCVLQELELPQVKSMIAYLMDAGPGVGISKFEVRF